MQRRKFIKNAAVMAALPAISSLMGAIESGYIKANSRILLRSSWQTVNIGDIGHTFGIMELFKTYLPEAEITLWPNSLDNGVDVLLKKSFRNLKLAPGKIDASGKPTTPALQQAFETCDIMVHGSGPWIVVPADLAAWHKQTGKPFGMYGISLVDADVKSLDLINKASFIYCRDTASLDYLKSLRSKCPITEFAPDATFAINLRNDKLAADYLDSKGLKSGEFICVIPRLRYTPYWKMKNIEPTEEESKKYMISQYYKDTDHAKLRDVMIRWVRETGLKILACPEVTYQVELAKEMLIDPLPEDVKKHVIWRDTYWIPDEAQSVYAKARALVSFEMHSPIIAFSSNVPAIHLRQPTDTRKGQMWADIGLAEWLFEIDFTSGNQIGDALMEIHSNYPKTLKKLAKAKEFVVSRQKDSIHKI
ncbi:polysaccharide pyruvyl transferase family protein [Pedobacter panaciterrae]|uniref:polysaccharide pyruvyl transferase family protein n=1 Tax=Pedobacter panaciterrae TaxID=363849 RepID=UPI00155DA2CC|nr:polysaccharide pyruvyl transferase family protein [Pedobacter panaciterrae]NQX53147.1 polysaccharide pyruvyl transferase family protein [Pedobacter panaciterrae]